MFRQYRPIERSEQFIVSVDGSTGAGDFTAGQFYSKTKKDVPLVYQSKNTLTSFTPHLAITLERLYDATGIKPLAAIERNNGGSYEMDRLAALNRENKFEIYKMPAHGRENAPEAVKLGFDTNTATRGEILQNLKDFVDNRLLIIYDRATINEFFSFITVQTATAWKAQAEKGAHDDLVMALAIALHISLSVKAPIANAAGGGPGPFEAFKNQAQANIPTDNILGI